MPGREPTASGDESSGMSPLTQTAIDTMMLKRFGVSLLWLCRRDRMRIEDRVLGVFAALGADRCRPIGDGLP